MATGGSIAKISLNGTPFSVAADADVTLILGGYDNEAVPNGDGTNRIRKVIRSASASGIVVSVNHNAGDYVTLQNLANLTDFFTATITLADGTIYTGDMQINDLNGSTNDTTATFNLQGNSLIPL